jgi:hypothetical protein
MRQYNLYQQDIGAPPPPPIMAPPPPPPPSTGMQSDKSSTRAIWALILGIAAFVLGCGILTGIPAWILGKKELNDIEAGLASPSGKTMAQIGMWLGIINVILSVLALIAVVIYFVFVVAIIGTSHH